MIDVKELAERILAEPNGRMRDAIREDIRRHHGEKVLREVDRAVAELSTIIR